MRVALLTMLEDAGPSAGSAVGTSLRRAGLRVGGASIARHQLALALTLGCERIVCLAVGFDADIAALHRVAEAAGARFHVIANPHALVGLVAADDELVAFADGLFVWPALANQLLAGTGVIVQPVEPGMRAGFERLDIHHASGGALRISGRLVGRLAELPIDCDAVSTLQRIALQAGVPQHVLSDGSAGGRWALIRSEAEAHGIEAAWIRLHTARGASAEGTAAASGESLAGMSGIAARMAVRTLGTALLHAGSRGGVVGAAAGLLLLLALIGGWFGAIASGLLLTAIAAILFDAATLLDRVEQASLHHPAAWLARAGVGAAMLDTALVLVIGEGTAREIRAATGGVADWGTRLFAPLVLVGAMRLAARVLPPQWRGWVRDRGLAALVLAVAAALSLLEPGVELGALVLIAASLIVPRPIRTGPHG